LGDNKHERGVADKKAWLTKRLKEGLVFRRLDARGKAFIEYMPSEKAWRPIVAPGWLTIHCLWVSGSLGKKGHARHLLEGCIADARRQKKAGVVVATGKKKRPFLGDPKFFLHFGFEAVERAGDFQLLALRLSKSSIQPRFSPAVLESYQGQAGPFVARYTDQCPFNAHWAREVVGFVENEGYDVSLEHITSRARAQKVASPLGAFGLECEGALVTYHLNTENAVKRELSRKVKAPE
jgi:predicted GNAT family acetyltransferase